MNSKQLNVKRKHRKAHRKLCKARSVIARKIEFVWASGRLTESDLIFLKNQLRNHKAVKKFMQLREIKSDPGYVMVSIATIYKLPEKERSCLRTFLRYAECCPNLKFW